MCRHLAYLGPPVALSRWLYQSPHALVQQSFAPRDMRGGGVVNADGFGVGWYGTGSTGPRCYRRSVPMWSDTQLPQVAADTTTTAMLAAVRSATTGMPVTETACAPFAGDGWLFSLNGRVAGWPGSVATLAGQLPVTDLLTLPAPTDSALLWALLRHRLGAGQPPPEAVAGLVRDLLAAAPDSRLNLLFTDSRTIVATTVTHALSVRQEPGSVLVSSEPLDDDPRWQSVPDGRLLVATPSGVEIDALPP